MLGLPDFLFSAETRKRWAEQERQINDALLEKPVDWDPTMKWDTALALRGETFSVRSLFEVKPVDLTDDRFDFDGLRADQKILSPNGKWLYCEKVLPPRQRLGTAYGRKKGFVLFDSPVIVPCLHARSRWDDESWDENPWMSMTPQEIFTLRCGTRFAKGHTIVAGLGLGHQLIECSKRKQVKKLTLVEISQELVDWLLPAIEPHLSMPVEVVVGDANKLIPDMEADAALIDIYASYGGNDFPYCRNIRKVWCWGSQYAE